MKNGTLNRHHDGLHLGEKDRRGNRRQQAST